MVIDAGNHTVSARHRKINRYGPAQTVGDHFALPVAEFTDDMRPIHEPSVGSQGDSGVHGQPSSLRSWARRDKDIDHTALELVLRRLIYDGRAGDLIVDEDVDRSAQTRRPFHCMCDTKTIFIYRAPAQISSVASPVCDRDHGAALEAFAAAPQQSKGAGGGLHQGPQNFRRGPAESADGLATVHWGQAE